MECSRSGKEFMNEFLDNERGDNRLEWDGGMTTCFSQQFNGCHGTNTL